MLHRFGNGTMSQPAVSSYSTGDAWHDRAAELLLVSLTASAVPLLLPHGTGGRGFLGCWYLQLVLAAVATDGRLLLD